MVPAAYRPLVFYDLFYIYPLLCGVKRRAALRAGRENYGGRVLCSGWYVTIMSVPDEMVLILLRTEEGRGP